MLRLGRWSAANARRSLLAAASHEGIQAESQACTLSPTSFLGALALGLRGVKKSAQQVRAGELVVRDGRPLRVVRFHWMHGQARAAGFVTLDLVDIATSSNTSMKLKLDDQLELADVEDKEMQVLYRDETGVHVMDGATFDQVALSPELFGDGRRWLGVEGLTASVSYFEGEPVAARVPYKLAVKVLDAPVAVVKDDGGSSRHVVVDGAVSVMAPAFIRTGDTIVVRTEDASYMTKVT